MSRLRCAWYRIEAAAASGLLFLMARAPLGVVLGVARLAARAAFVLWSRRRRIALENIRRAAVCADEAQVRALALASFVAFASRNAPAAAVCAATQ